MKVFRVIGYNHTDKIKIVIELLKKMKKLIIITLILAFSIPLFSQTKLDSLKSILKKVPDRERIEILDQLQKAYWDIYPKASIDYGKQAYKLSRKLKDKYQESIELGNIATAYTLLNNNYKALKNLLLSLELAEKINNDFLIVNRLNNISKAYLNLKDDVKAFEFTLKALRISKTNNNISGTASSFENLGDIYYSLDDIENAISRYKLSLNSYEKLENKLQAGIVLEKIGKMYIIQNNNEEALKFYLEASENFEKINNHEVLIKSYNVISSLYQTLGNDKDAYDYYLKYYEAQEKVKKEDEKNRNLLLYEYYRIIENDEKALMYYKLYTIQLDSLYLKESKKTIEYIQKKYEIEKQILKKDIVKDIKKKSDIELKKVKDETKEKEKEIKALKIDKAIKEILAKYETERREEIISNLRYEQEINDLKLSKQNRLRNFLVIISLLLLVSVGLIFNRYHLKTKLNKKLEQTNEFLVETSQELMQAQKKLERLARTDPLTQLSNRRDILEKIKYEKDRFERSKKPFTIVLGDIDKFKSVNDTYGHDAGDLVLMKISKLMISSLRKQDFVSRWGGEEFLLLLPETDIKGGKITSEKIRQKIAETKIHFKGKNIPVSMTFGVSTYSKTSNIDDCIAKADKALYQGKKSGRNKTVIAKDS